jgi:hypothetical protein
MNSGASLPWEAVVHTCRYQHTRMWRRTRQQHLRQGGVGKLIEAREPPWAFRRHRHVLQARLNQAFTAWLPDDANQQRQPLWS